MQCEYKRTMKKNEVVLWEEGTEQGPGFYEKMFTYNQIPGILPFVTEKTGDGIRYRYKLGTGESVKERYARKTMGYDQFRELLQKIMKVMEGAREYLLDERDYVLLPECMIYDTASEELKLCYYPMFQRNAEDQWAELLEYLLAHIDYKDMSVVTAVYELYMRSKKAGFGFAAIREVLGEKKPAPIETRLELLREAMKRPQEIKTEPDDRKQQENNAEFCLQAGQGEESIFITHFPFLVGENARLSRRGESIYVEDMKSASGAFVNGRRIAGNEILKLNIGDSVMLADRSYRFMRMG